MNRRRFLHTALTGSAALWLPPQWTLGSPFQTAPQREAFPVKFRKPNPYESVSAYIEAGHDEFPGEKRAEEITSLLLRAFEAHSFPLAADFQGSPPLPLRYKEIESNSRNAPVVRTAVFGGADRPFAQGVREWIESVGQVRSLRFYVTQIELGPGERTSVRVRYEIASRQRSASLSRGAVAAGLDE